MRLVKLWLPVVLWAGLILSSANDEFSASHSAGWLAWIFGDVPEVANIAFRKLTHLTVYGILGALAWRADRRWFVALGVVLLVASVDESLQSTTLTRSGSPWDVLLDLAGAGIALFILRRFAGSRPRLHPESDLPR